MKSIFKMLIPVLCLTSCFAYPYKKSHEYSERPFTAFTDQGFHNDLYYVQGEMNFKTATGWKVDTTFDPQAPDHFIQLYFTSGNLGVFYDEMIICQLELNVYDQNNTSLYSDIYQSEFNFFSKECEALEAYDHFWGWLRRYGEIMQFIITPLGVLKDATSIEMVYSLIGEERLFDTPLVCEVPIICEDGIYSLGELSSFEYQV